MFKLVFFDYREGRGHQCPVELLKDFKEYQQIDGFTVYDRFDKQDGVMLFNCIAHARRKFNDASDNDEARANYAFWEIQKLYAIEGSCKEQNLDSDQVLAHLHGSPFAWSYLK